MIKKPLLVLDFDGVIVDGIKEYWSSSRQTCLNIFSDKEKEIISFPTEIPKAFKAMRPWVHHGWEMVILAAECSNKTSQLNLKGLQNFSSNYQIECSLALEKWGWTPFQLQEAQRKRISLREWPEGWEAALSEAQQLINPWLIRKSS